MTKLDCTAVSPVFLLASERSGTNLLRRRLTEYQDLIHGPAPLHFLKHLHWALPYYGDLRDDKKFYCLVTDALGLARNHFSPWKLGFGEQDVVDQYGSIFRGSRTSVGLMHVIYTMYARQNGYQTYFCKDNNIFDFVADIRLELPEARFVYLYRDPRDVVLSQRSRPAQNRGVTYLSQLWRDEQIKCLRCLTMLELAESVTRVSYEDLVQSESEVLNNLGKFLGVSLMPVRKNLNENLDIHEWKNLNSETMSKNVGKFEAVLSEAAVKVIEGVCWNQMKYLGYETEFKERPLVSQSRQNFAVLASKVYRVVRSRVRSRFESQGQIDRAHYVGALQKKWK